MDRATRGENILDLVLSSETGLVDYNLRIVSPIGRGDHATILFDLSLVVNNKEDGKKGFDYRRADYGKFSADSLNVDWNEKFENETVDGMWTEFVRVVNGMKEKYVPRFAGSRKRKPKWMDYKACKALKKKYQAWKRYTDSPSYQG